MGQSSDNYAEIRLGKDWPAISHLNFWAEQEVDEYLMSLLASYENFQHVTFQERWGVKPTRIQRLMGLWMSGALEPNENHLRGVMAFRAATKTAVASNVCAWIILLDPRVSVKVISGGNDMAQAIMKECRAWFDTSPILEEYLHPTKLLGSATMMDNIKGFNVPGNSGGKDFTFSAKAIFGNITGSRAHVVLMDDIEQPDNCGTAEKREKLRARDSEANNILFDSKATEYQGILYDGFKPFRMYLGTPHAEESIYTHKGGQGFVFRVWPARYPNKKYMDAIGSMLCPELANDIKIDPSITTGHGLDFAQGKLVDVQRQSEEKLLQDERENGTAGFAKQFMLDVSLQNIDKYPLKINDLIVADLDSERARGSYMSERSPEYELKNLHCVGLPGDRFYRPSYLSEDSFPYDRLVMAIDPSGRGPDETAYAVVGALNGNFFLLSVGGFAGYGNGYSDEVLLNLAKIAKRFQVNEIKIENNFGDGMFTRMLQPVLKKVYQCSIDETRASGNKEARVIDTLEPVLSRRRLIVDSKAIENDYHTVPEQAKDSIRPSYRFIHQLARITRDSGSVAHDDRIDAVECAVRTLIDNLDLDQKDAEDSKLLAMISNDPFGDGVDDIFSLTDITGGSKANKNMGSFF